MREKSTLQPTTDPTPSAIIVRFGVTSDQPAFCISHCTCTGIDSSIHNDATMQKQAHASRSAFSRRKSVRTGSSSKIIGQSSTKLLASDALVGGNGRSVSPE